jgi:serine/threonine-protein kinase
MAPNDAPEAPRNLLIGLLALQLDLIDNDQFVEACLVCNRKKASMSDLLVELGWLGVEDRADLERLVHRKLCKHGGDAEASLASLGAARLDSLRVRLDDPDMQKSLALATRLVEIPPVSTIDHGPPPRVRYEVLGLHATGGLGRVWLARDNNLGRVVALKDLRSEPDPVVRARFLRKARITGQLTHPGIVPVYEVGDWPEGSRPFYTMQFVQGQTLRQRIKEFHEKQNTGSMNRMVWSGLLQTFQSVCNTIAYAHSHGVIHRDLKSQNIIVSKFGQVIVLDWGLARVLSEREADAEMVSLNIDLPTDDLTAHGQILGTPAYMSPEQAAGELERINRLTDVYGLGAILYEILCGQPPFRGADSFEILKKVREEKPRSPTDICPAVPKELADVCLVRVDT